MPEGVDGLSAVCLRRSKSARCVGLLHETESECDRVSLPEKIYSYQSFSPLNESKLRR